MSWQTHDLSTQDREELASAFVAELLSTPELEQGYGALNVGSP